MKKIIFLIVVITMSFILVGCNKVKTVEVIKIFALDDYIEE